MPIDVDLEVLGLNSRLRLVGARAESAVGAITTAWSRCLHAAPAGMGAVLELELRIADDSSPSAAGAENTLIAPDEASLLHALSPLITTRAIERLAGRAYMLHACGIAMDDGGVVAFVAASGGGKTTLARVLGQRHGYVTDETVAVRMDGSVIPYPKPLSAVAATGSALKDQLGPDALGLLIPPQDLRLVGVVLLERDAGADDVPEVEEVPILHGLAALTAQTSYLPRLHPPLQTALRLVEDAGGIRRVRYREAAELLTIVDSLRGRR